MTNSTTTDAPARKGLASRLYLGEAGIDVVGRRRILFGIVGLILLAAVISFGWRGFTLGIDFRGGNEFQVPASVGTLANTQTVANEVVAGVDPTGTVASVQQLGGSAPSYLIRTSPMSVQTTEAVKVALAERLHVTPQRVSDDRISAAWGGQVTRQALIGLAIFLLLVIGYLILRFEWRMAAAAVASLVFDLVLTAGVYSVVGFEVSPSTVVGFLTILGFALYDVVVVFDKIRENTDGLATRNTQTYAEAANLAVNQTLMRSINTGLVALLPVGGLLFIGAGLLGAGTLKDLGLVLFVGMGAAVCSSIFFATPVLVTLKQRQPAIQAHTRRVLARRHADLGRRRATESERSEQTQREAVPAGAAAGKATAGLGSAMGSGAPRPGAKPRTGRPAQGRRTTHKNR